MLTVLKRFLGITARDEKIAALQAQCAALETQVAVLRSKCPADEPYPIPHHLRFAARSMVLRGQDRSCCAVQALLWQPQPQGRDGDVRRSRPYGGIIMLTMLKRFLGITARDEKIAALQAQCAVLETQVAVLRKDPFNLESLNDHDLLMMWLHANGIRMERRGEFLEKQKEYFNLIKSQKDPTSEAAIQERESALARIPEDSALRSSDIYD